MINNNFSNRYFERESILSKIDSSEKQSSTTLMNNLENLYFVTNNLKYCVKITIPNNNVLERKYILNIIFNEFFGLKYDVIESEYCQNWEIELNDKKLIIKDTFFSKYKNDLEYLKKDNIIYD